jgi:hypothetical protein
MKIKDSLWVHRGKVERRIQQVDLDAHLSVGFVRGRIPGRVQSEESRRSRQGPKTKPGKLAKYGVTVEQFRDAKDRDLKWCTGHRRFEDRRNFHVGCKLCKDASRERDSLAYALHGVAQRNHVSGDWYPAKLAEQGGHCALCPATVGSVRNPRFCYDHDHQCCAGRWSCGKCLRGLLCNSCNYRVGQLEEFLKDGDWMSRASAYVARQT